MPTNFCTDPPPMCRASVSAASPIVVSGANYFTPAGVSAVTDVRINGLSIGTQGTDYTATLTPTGVQINALEEWAADPNETIIITLQGVSGNAQTGTTTVHTVTLTDPAAPAIAVPIANVIA